MENNKSLIKPAFKNYSKVFVKSLPFLLLFTLIVLAIWMFDFVLTMYGSGLGIFNLILVGLIIVPFYFSTQICVYMIYRDGREVPSQHFFRLFKLYFKPNFVGIYRIIRTFLFSILWGIAASFLFSIIYSALAESIDPGFATALDSLYAYIEAGDAEAAYNYMLTSEPYVRFSNMATFVSTTAESISFLFYMARNTATMYVSEIISAPSPKFVVDSYKNAFRGNHIPGYNKDFLKGTWFLFVLFLFMYAAGAIVGYFAFAGNELQFLLMTNLGLGFSLVLLPFVLPYFFLFLTNLIDRYRKGFFSGALELIRFSYEEMKSRGMFKSEEEEAKYKEGMKSYEDEVNKHNETIDANTEEKEDINTDDYGSSDHH